MCGHRSPKPRAFTLIELILVLVILAFVAAMIAPSLRGFGVGRRIQDTAVSIVSVANYVRTQAVTEGQAYRLNIDGNTYWLTVNADGVFQTVPSKIGDRSQVADGVTMQCDVKRQQDGQYIAFLPTGRSDPARITLTDGFGKQIVIAASSTTEPMRMLTAEEASR